MSTRSACTGVYYSFSNSRYGGPNTERGVPQNIFFLCKGPLKFSQIVELNLTNGASPFSKKIHEPFLNYFSFTDKKFKKIKQTYRCRLNLGVVPNDQSYDTEQICSLHHRSLPFTIRAIHHFFTFFMAASPTSESPFNLIPRYVMPHQITSKSHPVTSPSDILRPCVKCQTPFF